MRVQTEEQVTLCLSGAETARNKGLDESPGSGELLRRTLPVPISSKAPRTDGLLSAWSYYVSSVFVYRSILDGTPVVTALFIMPQGRVVQQTSLYPSNMFGSLPEMC